MGRMVEVHSSEVGKPTTSHSPFFFLSNTSLRKTG